MPDGTVIDRLVTELLYVGDPAELARHRREVERDTAARTRNTAETDRNKAAKNRDAAATDRSAGAQARHRAATDATTASLVRQRTALRGAATEIAAVATTLGTIGAAGAAVLGASAREAIRWEDARVGVRKTVDATEEEYARLFANIREMARNEIPETAVDLARIAEEGGQLGIRTENIEDFTRIVGMLRTTTNLGDAAGTSMARFSNIVGLSQDNFDRLGATVVDLGNNLATTESEIFTMALRVGGMARQVKIGAAETLGWAAGLSSLGLEAEMGGSAISRVFAELDKAAATRSPELGVVAKVSGVGTEEFRRLFREDASRATLSFLSGLDAMRERGENVHLVLEALGFDQIRVRDLLLRAAGANDLVARSLDLSKVAWLDNEALQEEFAKKAAATSSQIKFLMAEIRGLAIEVGDALIPIIRELVAEYRPVIRATAEWVRANPEAVGTLAKLVAGIVAVSTAGLILAGVLRGLAFGLGAMEVIVRVTRWLFGLEVAAKAAGAAGATAGTTQLPKLAGGLAGVSRAIAGPAGLIALLISAAAAWAVFWKNANDQRLPNVRAKLDALAPGDPRRARVSGLVEEAEAIQAQIDETKATGDPVAIRRLADEQRRRQFLLGEIERALDVDDLGTLAEQITRAETDVGNDEARAATDPVVRRRLGRKRARLDQLREQFVGSFEDRETGEAELRRLTFVGPVIREVEADSVDVETAGAPGTAAAAPPVVIPGVTAPLPAGPAPVASAGPTSIVVNQSGATINLTVPPGADADEIGEIIEDRVREETARQNRVLVEQLDSQIAR